MRGPGNIFNGVVNPTLGYGIKGVIWYQGESNASRACEYADSVPLHDRAVAQGVEARAISPSTGCSSRTTGRRSPTPGDSNWAELREAQTQDDEAAEHRPGGDHRPG